MNVIFEEENGLLTWVCGIKLHQINDRVSRNQVLDAYLSDPAFVKMYIIADDNYIGPRGPTKAVEEIEDIEKIATDSTKELLIDMIEYEKILQEDDEWKFKISKSEE